MVKKGDTGKSSLKSGHDCALNAAELGDYDRLFGTNGALKPRKFCQNVKIFDYRGSAVALQKYLQYKNF